jgi:hypothetical protein
MDIRQILAWQVGDDMFRLEGGAEGWALSSPGGELALSGPALTALAEAIVRVGFAPETEPAKKRGGPARAGKPWSAEEDEALERRYIDEGLSRSRMAEQHARSVSAINARLVHLGLADPVGTARMPSDRRFPAGAPA